MENNYYLSHHHMLPLYLQDEIGVELHYKLKINQYLLFIGEKQRLFILITSKQTIFR